MARYVETDTTSKSIWTPVVVIIIVVLLALAAWYIYAQRHAATTSITPTGSTQQTIPTSTNSATGSSHP